MRRTRCEVTLPKLWVPWAHCRPRCWRNWLGFWATTDEWVRRNVALGLARLGPAAEAVQPAVVAALDDPNRYVSAKAGQDLGAHWDDGGDGEFVRLFVRRPMVSHHYQGYAVLRR